MGCCMQNTLDIKSYDVVLAGKNSISHHNQDFVDISLSSEEEVPMQKVDEWIKFKQTKSKSLSDSLAMMSTLQHSERKISVYSKPGSMVDSFVVSLPLHK
ncbi:hypothetical protein SteCoe_28937 [Stentor coeruleus]|jgi:bacillopeptidase F (M6 metalloprotease family)|uniref:Uncharacterized protein n=1 Tax=Stentor coeruleus TaxID=5963 RepID=A0A1R2B7J0_9CILI|nr:hypothetical protein SteCoe_28937 [Stentor coeruleus]